MPLEEFAIVDGIEQSRFVDVAPILVTSVESLADLNNRLDNPIPMEKAINGYVKSVKGKMSGQVIRIYD